MSNSDLTSVLLILLLLVALAQLLGYLFVKLRPTESRRRNPGWRSCSALLSSVGCHSRPGFVEATQHQANILNFVYWLGLLLLMFLSGAETHNCSVAKSAAKWAGSRSLEPAFRLSLGWY